MSKKIKGVSFDSYEVVGHEDSGARFKHQTLLQGYFELKKKTEAARSKLGAMKLKKLTLQAEVRFLRRRYKFLLKNESLTPQTEEPAIIKPRFIEANEKAYLKKKKKKKKAALLNINHKENVCAKKKNVRLGIPSNMLHGVMKESHQRATQESDLNQTVKINSLDVVDLKKETTVKTRALTFDLNQISREEEEELQKSHEPTNLVKSVIDEKLNELKFSMFRNIFGDASKSQARKRKISWQDPVALLV